MLLLAKPLKLIRAARVKNLYEQGRASILRPKRGSKGPKDINFRCQTQRMSSQTCEIRNVRCAESRQAASGWKAGERSETRAVAGSADTVAGSQLPEQWLCMNLH